CPWDKRPGDTEPSRSVEVSWSESKDSATQTRAPFFQRSGRRDRPARTFSTAPRQRDSPHAQAGSVVISCALMEPPCLLGRRHSSKSNVEGGQAELGAPQHGRGLLRV